VLPRAEKVALTAEATRVLGDALEDLAVRDLGLRDEGREVRRGR
jgi:hypothetical protein